MSLPRGSAETRLDPRAPPEDAAAAMTDQSLVANAYLVGVTGLVGQIAKLLGKTSDEARYAKDHDRLRKEFRKEYVTANGRMASDSQTAFVLALQWGLLEKDQVSRAVEQLVKLISKDDFTIGTGFAGTPFVLSELTKHGRLDTAYQMIKQTKCPSWLYPVTMGATTIWERWDSLLPDGNINVSLPAQLALPHADVVARGNDIIQSLRPRSSSQVFPQRHCGLIAPRTRMEEDEDPASTWVQRRVRLRLDVAYHAVW